MPIYNDLTDDEIIELWEERSAIMENDGELSRELADRRAYFDIRNLIGNVPVPQVIRDDVRLK